jgi:hypothetical protein
MTKAARRWCLYPHNGFGELMSPLSRTVTQMQWPGRLPVFLSVSRSLLSRLLRLNTQSGRCGVLNSSTNAVWGAQSLRLGVCGTMGGRARHDQAAIPFAESLFKRTLRICEAIRLWLLRRNDDRLHRELVLQTWTMVAYEHPFS